MENKDDKTPDPIANRAFALNSVIEKVAARYATETTPQQYTDDQALKICAFLSTQQYNDLVFKIKHIRGGGMYSYSIIDIQREIRAILPMDIVTAVNVIKAIKHIEGIKYSL